MNTAYPELLEAIRACITKALAEAGIDAERAPEIAMAAAERVRREFGGQSLYIPRATSYNAGMMAVEILRRWNGKNTRALCVELDISERRLRQLHAEARAGDLFASLEPPPSL